jgi:tRNA(Ile)-lysidine synthase
MRALLARVGRTIRRTAESAPTTVAVAVSGGSDSVALAWLSASWRPDRGRRCRSVHINHQLRVESDADEASAARWRTPRPAVAVAGIDVGAQARTRVSIEVAARNARYASSRPR